MTFKNISKGWMVVEDAGGGDYLCIPDVWRVVQSNCDYVPGELVYIGAGPASCRPNVPMDPGKSYNHADKLVMAKDVLAVLDSWPLVAE